MKTLARKTVTPTEMLLLGQVVPNGSGFSIIPKKPVAEITTKQAAQILGCSQRQISNLVNSPRGSKILRWRWQGEGQGKRLFELDSPGVSRGNQRS